MRTIAIILVALISQAGFSQSMITLEESFEQALQNNFQLQILDNQVKIAENSATRGNAGMLPDVTLSGSYGGNLTNTTQQFVTESEPSEIRGARSMNSSADATVSYVLFDGLTAQRTYDRLLINAKAVDLQSRAQVESILLQVANAYYALAQAIEQESIATSNVEVSAKRYERAELANELGTSIRTELLSARVDLTSDSSSLLEAQLQRENAQRNLERLTGVTHSDQLITPKLELAIHDWSLEQLQSEAVQNNADLKNSELQVELAKKDYDLAYASLYPRLSVSGGYSYNNQQSDAGILVSNSQTGWNGSLSLSYPIFTGGRNKIERQNQVIQLESSKLELQDQQAQLQTDLSNAWSTYLQSVKVYEFESKNLSSAELNLQRSEEMYKTGQATSTEFREAQVSLASARQRINNALVSVKLNELEIMRLSGQILSKQ